jgi:hypothetical protein
MTEELITKEDQFASLKERLRKVFSQAGVIEKTKSGKRTVTAATVEFSFLLGYMFATPDKEPHPYILMIMMSGRSILDPI